ncbi:MAG: site-specific integrase [Planctomycetota bacterium]|nr:site-specific integrase [Planctomycetota bacterium]
MASIGNDHNGHRRILFVAGDGSRKTIRLGLATMKQAEAFRTKVEALIGGSITGIVDDETSRWLADLPDAMHSRLAAVGLVKSRNRTATTVKMFLADYFAGLSVKASTAEAYGDTRRCLIEFFGESRPVRSIEPLDADGWRQHLKAAGLAEATVGRRVGAARMMFKCAVKWKLIGQNPFADVKTGSQSNKDRMFFITLEAAQKVLDACPDAQWRLLFALSRYGGLRCPSEHLALKWGDVDWEHNRIRVPSPKTAHHEGGDCRFIPLFPELRPHLQEVFDEAEPGTEYVITKYRWTNCNLRTQLYRIIMRAGLKPWPKPFHNLRSSRQTELAEKYPIHVVCAWLGNSRAIAQEHYLQVTDSHFADAAKEPTPTANVKQEATNNSAAQNAAQYTAVTQRTDRKATEPTDEKSPDLPGDSESYRLVHNTPAVICR